MFIYSTELENGNLFIERGLGRGIGNWRLELTSNVNFEAIAYSVTQEGYLTNLTQTVQAENGCWRIPLFYSSDNLIESQLRISNVSDEPAIVSISGRDDVGTITARNVSIEIEPAVSITLSAEELENGSSNLSGMLGHSNGDWQLALQSNVRIDVMNLLVSSRGELSNISEKPSYAVGHCWLDTTLATTDRSIGEILDAFVDAPHEQQPDMPPVPGLYAAVVNPFGIESIGARGVKKYGETEPVSVHDKLLISSNTKPMTATMVAVLVSEGVFRNGWDTTWASIFPELVDEVHADYHSATLRQFVIHEAAVPENLDLLWQEDLDDTLRNRRVTAMVAHMRELAITSRNQPAKVGEFMYSHVGYMVVGAMVERVTGRSFEELMHEKLFMPLGMASAGYDNPGDTEALDEPWGHFYSDERDWVPTQSDYSPIMRPSGGVHVTLEDWGKFLQLWLPGKRPVLLDRSTLNDMLTFAWLDGPRSIFLSGGINGAGWFYYPIRVNFGSALNHPGSNLRWHSLVWVLRDINKAYIVISNAHVPPHDDFGRNPTYTYVLNPVYYLLFQASTRVDLPDQPSQVLPSVPF